MENLLTTLFEEFVMLDKKSKQEATSKPETTDKAAQTSSALQSLTEEILLLKRKPS